MTSKAIRYVKAGIISAVLLLLVLWIAGVQSVDFSAVRPIFLVPTLVAYGVVLMLRAALMQRLTVDQTQSSYRQFLTLAARHQLVFIVSPSGAGDLAFPLLAGRTVGLKTSSAIRLIAETRMRDILAVLSFGFLGLALSGYAPYLTGFGAFVGFVALFFSDISVNFAISLLRRLRKKEVEPDPKDKVDVKISQRGTIAFLTTLIWAIAAFGITSGFLAAGYPISVAESWIMLAGLNIAGALAMSIAGLGVAEAGATGVLVFFGLPVAEAAGIAIIARPLLLLSNAASCGIIELVIRATGGIKKPTLEVPPNTPK